MGWLIIIFNRFNNVLLEKYSQNSNNLTLLRITCHFYMYFNIYIARLLDCYLCDLLKYVRKTNSVSCSSIRDGGDEHVALEKARSSVNEKKTRRFAVEVKYLFYLGYFTFCKSIYFSIKETKSHFECGMQFWSILLYFLRKYWIVTEWPPLLIFEYKSFCTKLFLC